jgi:phospholipase/carboxylesterase
VSPRGAPATGGLPAPPLRHLTRAADGEPQGALVLLHGRGASEHDLAPLADAIDPERRLVALLPRGPLSLPPGGAHWYRVMQIGYPDPGTFLPTFQQLAGWLDTTLEQHGITPQRAVIGGFSQGAVMSWALGLGEGRPTPGGILALSGFMPTVEGFALDLDRPGLRAAIGHGTFDPVIGVEWGRDARDRLIAAGHAPLYRESPMAHTIDPAYVEELRDWVAQSTGARSGADG